jgi:hypothetical protein
MQRYYRKAKKGSVAQMDISLLAEAVAAISVLKAQPCGVLSQPSIGAVVQPALVPGGRGFGLDPLIPMETKPFQLLKMGDCLLVEEVSVAAALPVLDSDGVATSMKADVKHSTPVRGFLRLGFLKPSPALQVFPHLSHKVSVASPSTLVLKEDWVEGAPSLLGGVFNGLIQSQKWLVGFGPSGEIVLWDQGDEV